MDWIDKPRLHSPHPGIWDSAISNLQRLSRWLRIPHLALPFLVTLLESRNWMTLSEFQSKGFNLGNYQSIQGWFFNIWYDFFSNMAFSPLTGVVYSMRVISTFPHWGYETIGVIFRCKGASWLSEAKRKRNPEVDREQCIEENSANLVRLTRDKVRVVRNSFAVCAATCQGGRRLNRLDRLGRYDTDSGVNVKESSRLQLYLGLSSDMYSICNTMGEPTID